MCLESEDFFKDPEKKGKKDYLYFHDRACESAEKEYSFLDNYGTF